MIAIKAHDLGQHVRITSVALGSRGGVPLPVPRRREWVDRGHPVASGPQRSHPRATVGLDPNDHLTRHLLGWQLRPRCRGVLGHQRVQPGDALQALWQPSPREPTPVLILKLDVVMVLSPVVSDE